MTQAEIAKSLENSLGFYNLFKTLSPETRQGFLKLLFEDNSSEFQDLILYLACERSRREGFLSESESQSFLERLA
ncbi:MAG: hypothetical protein ACOYME_12910 [Prochlorotrichaceae cyanobacterium]|jgi:hypothetical protein